MLHNQYAQHTTLRRSTVYILYTRKAAEVKGRGCVFQIAIPTYVTIAGREILVEIDMATNDRLRLSKTTARVRPHRATSGHSKKLPY
jgi:hypothetical protein